MAGYLQPLERQPAHFTPKTIWTWNPGNVGHDYVKRVMLDR